MSRSGQVFSVSFLHDSELRPICVQKANNDSTQHRFSSSTINVDLLLYILQIFLFRSKQLPANLIQAQRDYFGAHTYELLAAPGKFVHTNWTGTGGNVSASTYSA